MKKNLPVLENVSLPRVGALKVILDSVAAEKHDGRRLCEVQISFSAVVDGCCAAYVLMLWSLFEDYEATMHITVHHIYLL